MSTTGSYTLTDNRDGTYTLMLDPSGDVAPSTWTLDHVPASHTSTGSTEFVMHDVRRSTRGTVQLADEPEELGLRIMLAVKIDTRAYATEYGLTLDSVPEDATEHIGETAKELLIEQLNRLGYGRVVGNTTTRTE